MKRIFKIIIFLSALILVTLTASASSVTITDLGTLGGSESWAYGINDKGQIVGCSYTGPGYERHAFLWQNSVMTDPRIIGDTTNPGIISDSSCAEGINENGQIVGHCYMRGETPSGVSGSGHAFLWQNGVTTDITASELGSFATGINDKGQVVGYSAYEPGGRDAFLWQNGVMTHITYGDFKWTDAMGINENGQIIGCNGSAEYGNPNHDGHAFLWQNDVMTDLGTLGGSESFAMGINDKVQVVGGSKTDTDETHAFLWQNNVMTDLGTLGGRSSTAYGINNKGQVVGESEVETGDTHAFLWQDGVIIDLGTLPGGSSSRAYEINENGQVAGESDTGNGEISPYTGTVTKHAVLWTVTEPSKPVANFFASPTSGNAPLYVAFTDTSTGTPTSWNWIFGDGATSTQQNPTHTYSSAGNFTVNLTVSDEAGMDSETKTGYINVNPVYSTLIAAFSVSPTSGNAPLYIAFTDTSTGTPTSWNWTFGDGTTSKERNPTHTYSAAGTYAVALTVSNEKETASNTATINVLDGSTSGGDNNGGDDNGGSSHGSSGGSGGGTGGSPEPQKNVASKDTAKVFVPNEKQVFFDFINGVTTVESISFTSKKTMGKITAITEDLKNKSTLVSDLPAGVVYKSFNVWVGNAGYGSSDNIQDAAIDFKVNNAWIKENNINQYSITLYKYDNENKEWIKLPVTMINEDKEYLHFTAETSGYFSFVVVGEKAESTLTAEFTSESVRGEVRSAGNGTVTKGTAESPGFGIIGGIACLLCMFLYRIKDQ